MHNKYTQSIVLYIDFRGTAENIDQFYIIIVQRVENTSRRCWFNMKLYARILSRTTVIIW